MPQIKQSKVQYEEDKEDGLEFNGDVKTKTHKMNQGENMDADMNQINSGIGEKNPEISQ